MRLIYKYINLSIFTLLILGCSGSTTNEVSDNPNIVSGTINEISENTNELATNTLSNNKNIINATNITSNSVIIKWELNKYVIGQVFYGIDNSDGENSTEEISAFNKNVIKLEGLSANTLYHYKVVFTDTHGNSIKSLDKTFKTLNQEHISSAIGMRAVKSTSVSKGTLFTSPKGRDTNSGSKESPYDLKTALTKLKPGSVLFLRGGSYEFKYDGQRDATITKSGTVSDPIIIESYPGENAVIDGSKLNTTDKKGTVIIRGDYIRFRKIEVKNMPKRGIYSSGNNNVIEGCRIHHNHSTGVSIIGGENNIIRDNIVYHNSDVGLTSGSYANGDNADGIGTSGMNSGLIEYNTVYLNSDDGIDTYNSNNVMVSHNIVHSHGRLGGDGNGNGIKLGKGDANKAYFNIAYNNKSKAFDNNTGTHTEMVNNTAWDNDLGFSKATDTIAKNNISADNTRREGDSGTMIDNSWQRNGTVTFISTDPKSPDFLKPIVDGGFEDIGALID